MKGVLLVLEAKIGLPYRFQDRPYSTLRPDGNLVSWVA